MRKTVLTLMVLGVVTMACIVLMAVLSGCDKNRARILLPADVREAVLQQCLERLGRDRVREGEGKENGVALCSLVNQKTYVGDSYDSWFYTSSEMLDQLVVDLRAMGLPATMDRSDGDAVMVCWGKNFQPWHEKYCKLKD